MTFLKVLRVGLYERVSTEEQALRGFSIDAQKANLEEYAKNNNMKIVDHYTDEGVSGAKPPLKRPALKRLIEDVEAGKIDMILFTKLDRWFRSVKEYFKVQEILDKHRVEWKAIEENYDTSTANGQMAITMFLAIAQNERDRTAERIKTVLEHKRKNKEACFSKNSIPWGYIKEPDENGIMRLVKDPEIKDIVQEFWDILLESNNLHKAIRHMYHQYGLERDWQSWKRMTTSDFYCGIHRGVQDFCPPYVSPEAFLKYNESRPIKATPTGRIYILKGLMRCPKCNGKLTGDAAVKPYGVYKSYRCKNRCKTCEYNMSLSEKKMEKELLNRLGEFANKTIKAEVKRLKAKPKPKTDVSKLNEKLRRLNVMYMAGNKTDEEYIAETKEIKDLILKAEDETPAAGPNINQIQELLASDFKSTYATLTDEEKQIFWTRLIKEIRLDGRTIKDIIFF